MELENVRLSYDPKTDTVRITSSDPRFEKKPFSVVLPNGSNPNLLARDVLNEAGLTLAANKEVSETPVVSDPASNKVGKRSILTGFTSESEPVYLTENEIRMHGIIAGTHHFPMFQLVPNLMSSLLKLGWEGVVIDSQSSYRRGFVTRWAKDANLTIEEFSDEMQEASQGKNSGTSQKFNPFESLTVEQIVKVLKASLPVEKDIVLYDIISNQILKTVVSVINYGLSVSSTPEKSLELTEIIKVLKKGFDSIYSTEILDAAVNLNIVSLQDLEFLKSKDAAFTNVLASIISNLSQVKNLNNSWGGNYDNANLSSYFNYQKLFYLGVVKERSEIESKLFIQAKLEQLINEMSARITSKGSGKKQKFVVITNTESIAIETLEALIARGRSAGIAFIFQISDLSKVPSASVFENTNFKFLFSQREDENAKLAAELTNEKVSSKEFKDMLPTESILKIERPNKKVTKFRIVS